MLARNVLAAAKTARFTRANSTLSNTTSTVKAVNSVNANSQESQSKANSILSEALGSKSSTSASSFYAKRTFEPLSNIEQDPYDFATRFVLPDKLAGRSVSVLNRDLDRAVYQFDSLVRSNRLREVNYEQRFFIKPNKRRLAKRVANRKRVFESGIAKLFQVVKDAVRKGY
ncbi:hypothetical protein C6P40_002817 [Pichia californica]|uniref:Uncharacterized protein n=1 Tax=Pichia californica TaxID=460514 RepID=A0A9P7BCN5_9ASCO|nr:hypothetical protein C6P42_002276 [[Candida] californica]KAG0687137.1 hypothetical protein C6P40_002817 [[Candida] californica]